MGKYKIALPIYGFDTEVDHRNAEKTKPFVHIPTGVIYWYPSMSTLASWCEMYHTGYSVDEFEFLSSVSQDEIDRFTSAVIPMMVIVERK
jgi:hypothetical protein